MNIQNQVLSTSGNSFTVGNTSIDFTFGETFTSTLPLGSTNMITQGFQQPIRKKIIINVNDATLNTNEIEGFSIISYPNPFSSNITVELSHSKELVVKIFDIFGREIKQMSFSDLITTLDLSDLTAGKYQMLIVDGNDTIKSFLIIKSN